MNKLIVVLGLIIPISSIAQSAQQKVRNAFESYKTAVLNGHAELAINHVDSATISYYQNIYDLVTKADSVQVDTLPILAKLTVLTIRHRNEPEELRGINGRGMLVYIIRKGMIKKESVEKLSIGEVMFNGDDANGEILVNGKLQKLYYGFSREENVWKVDLTSVMGLGEKMMKQSLVKNGKPENENIMTLLEGMTGKKPNASVWKPLIIQ